MTAKLNSRVIARTVMGVAVTIGFVLRVHTLGDSNVWWDEAYSVYLARKDLVALALETVGDVHPPVHYWLLHIWLRLAGHSEFALRYTSVWFGVLSIPMLYWLGHRAFGRWIGVVSGLLLATSRFHVEWSQQIRMYTLATMLAILQIALICELLKRPRPRIWIAYWAVTVLSLHILYLSGLVPLVASLVVGLLWLVPLGGRRLRTGFLVRWVVVQIACVATFSPWIAMFLGTARAEPKLIYPIDLRTFLHASATVLPLGVSTYLDSYRVATLAATAILALSIVKIKARTLQRIGVLLYALLILPPLIVYALSLPNPILYAPNLSVRYIIMFVPAYYLLLSVAVVWLCLPAKRLGQLVWSESDSETQEPLTGSIETALHNLPPESHATPSDHGSSGLGGVSEAHRTLVTLALRASPGLIAIAFLASIAAWSLQDYYPSRVLRDDYQSLAHHLKAHSRAGDAIVLSSDHDWPIFAYYYPGPMPRYGLSYLEPASAETVSALMDRLWERYDAIWLLTSYEAFDSDPDGRIMAWLNDRAGRATVLEVGHRRIELFSTDPSRGSLVPNVIAPQRQLLQDFEGNVLAIGYDLPLNSARAGECLTLAIYWKATGEPSQNLQAAYRLYAPTGDLFRQVVVPLAPPAVSESWQAEQTIRVDYHIAIPRALPVGQYLLTVDVVGWEPSPVASNGEPREPPPGRAGDHGARLRQRIWSVLAGAIRLVDHDPKWSLPTSGSRVVDGIGLASVVVLPSDHTEQPAAAEQTTHYTLGSLVELIGYDLRIEEPVGSQLRDIADFRLPRGAVIHLGLRWRSLGVIDRPYTVFVQLVGQHTVPATGNPVWAQVDRFPQGGMHPTTDWVPGQVVHDYYELSIPEEAPAGEYRLQVGLYDTATGQRLPVTTADGSTVTDDAIVILRVDVVEAK